MSDIGAYLKMLERRIEQLEANGTPLAGSGNGFDADTVDTIHAATSATANKLLALDADKDLHLDTGDMSGALLNVTGQITSTLATGTAPLAVTSTTVNTNLNADTVDGLHASAIGTKVLVASGASTTDWTHGAGVAFEDDTQLDVNITPTVTSTLIVFLWAKMYSAAANTFALRVILDNTTTAGETETAVCTAGQGLMASTIAVFTGVTAAAHLLEPQVWGGGAILVGDRKMVIWCIPE